MVPGARRQGVSPDWGAVGQTGAAVRQRRAAPGVLFFRELLVQAIPRFHGEKRFNLLLCLHSVLSMAP